MAFAGEPFDLTWLEELRRMELPDFSVISIKP